MPTYIALMRKEEDSDYGVDFPDFPGCVTAGSTLEEARQCAAEALAFHAEGMLEDGESLPAPSPLEEILTDPTYQNAAVFLVDLPADFSRTVRVNITVPEYLLRRIDSQARARGLSRSAFLVEKALHP
jgi:predicted RNase H-like HicB family nuclease